MNYPGCTYSPETVVFAHTPLPGEHGMGIKGDDLFGCFACAPCHDVLDGRRDGLKKFSEDWLFYVLRALTRTLRRLYEMNILSIKGAK